MENKDSKMLDFVKPEKGAAHYVRRYLNEPGYKNWFHRNYPNHTIFEGIGISEEEFKKIAADLVEPKPEQETTHTDEKLAGPDDTAESKDLTNLDTDQVVPRGEDLAKTVFESYGDDRSYDRRTFEEFVDERVLVSRDLFGKKEMKIKVLEVSDEIQESKIRWKFGDRVKVNKILITIKHLDTMEVEEGEFDIEAIEKELAEKRHWSSTNRWIPSSDIKNGYVVNSKHTALISDAVALDYIVF